MLRDIYKIIWLIHNIRPSRRLHSNNFRTGSHQDVPGPASVEWLLNVRWGKTEERGTWWYKLPAVDHIPFFPFSQKKQAVISIVYLLEELISFDLEFLLLKYFFTFYLLTNIYSSEYKFIKILLPLFLLFSGIYIFSALLLWIFCKQVLTPIYDVSKSPLHSLAVVKEQGFIFPSRNNGTAFSMLHTDFLSFIIPWRQIWTGWIYVWL